MSTLVDILNGESGVDSHLEDDWQVHLLQKKEDPILGVMVGLGRMKALMT